MKYNFIYELRTHFLCVFFRIILLLEICRKNETLNSATLVEETASAINTFGKKAILKLQLLSCNNILCKLFWHSFPLSSHYVFRSLVLAHN